MSALPVGTRVMHSDEEWGTADRGEVVQPTEQEIADSATWEYPPSADEVLVEWPDGERYWEHVTDLRVLS